MSTGTADLAVFVAGLLSICLKLLRNAESGQAD
jgi:hypothetical protein